jgi:hypothetical protein
MARRLRVRCLEIEEAILVRIYAVSDPSGEDAGYLHGLRATVTAAVAYGLLAIERGEESSGPIPSAMLAQARHAARNGIGLDTVLRRYVAGYTALGDFLMQEARDGNFAVDGAVLYGAQKELAAHFDRTVAAVTVEYGDEAERVMRSREERLAERVRRLLAGDLVDTADLAYRLDAWHVGVIATGTGAEKTLRDLAAALDCQLLLVGDGERALWAWLGARRRIEIAELAHVPQVEWPPDVALAIGEPARGLRGWRFTHRQANAALTVALHRPQPLTFYSSVGVIASMLQDDLLVDFLSEAYLTPLSAERDGGVILRNTLGAYFAAECNASSAAATLGVSRQTVKNRLRIVEERLGCPLNTCGPAIKAALQLAEVGAVPRSQLS